MLKHELNINPIHRKIFSSKTTYEMNNKHSYEAYSVGLPKRRPGLSKERRIIGVFPKRHANRVCRQNPYNGSNPPM